jgi:hypothetical protein
MAVASNGIRDMIRFPMPDCEPVPEVHLWCQGTPVYFSISESLGLTALASAVYGNRDYFLASFSRSIST